MNEIKEFLKFMYNTMNFIKLFPKQLAYRCCQLHIDMHRLFDLDPEELLILAARGFGKTTHIQTQVLKLVAYRKRRCIMVISQSQVKADQFLRNIYSQATDSEKYLKLYDLKIVKMISGKLVFDTGDGDEITIFAFGIEQDIRGWRDDHSRRPDQWIIDDAEGKEARMSETIRERVASIYYHEIKHGGAAGEKPAKIWHVGTVVHEDGLLMKLYLNADIQKLFHSALDENMKSTWEEMHPTEKLLAERAEAVKRGTLASWEMEMMNNPTAEEEKPFKATQIGRYNRRLIFDNLNKYLRLTVADVAYGNMSMNDYMVVTTVAIDRVSGVWFILEMTYTKEDVWDKCATIARHYKDYGAILIGTEDNGGFKQTLEQYFKQKGLYANIQLLNPKRTQYEQKNYRIYNYLYPKFAQSLVNIPEEIPTWYYTFQNEINKFSLDKDNKQDNGLDTLAYIAFLEQDYGVGSFTMKNEYIESNDYVISHENSPYDWA